ncbi:MAG: LAGLIDADG family homing endonuclease [Candidatus Woesearchaeota archaeon]
MVEVVEDFAPQFQRFFERYYYPELLEKIRKSEKFIVVDFGLLSEFDPGLAESVLESPDDTLRYAEIAIEQFGIGDSRNFLVRLRNLPVSQKIMIRNIRSNHIGKLFWMDGIVRQKSDVRPQVTNSKFECPSCGTVIAVLQLDNKFKEPRVCGCGRKGRFRLVAKELVDAQSITLEEAPEDLEGGEQPKRMKMILKGDLVSPMSEKRTNPGTKILAIGVIKELPITLKTGGQSTRFDLFVEANFVESVQEEFIDLDISSDEIEEIKVLADDPKIYQKMVDSIAPTIYGHDAIKEALLYQLMGGVRKSRDSGVVTRGDIHILLIGDPGCIAGDSRVALAYKGMKRIDSLGKNHLQPIHEVVTKIRRDARDKCYDFATRFHYYLNQPSLKVTTETGKEVICTYNQPFLTKEGWVRADDIISGESIRVMPKIPNMVKNYVPTLFTRVKKSCGSLKNVELPEFFTPALASLCGYIIGDGHVRKRGYSIACYVNEEENDLVDKISNLCLSMFNIIPSVLEKQVGGGLRTIDDGSGLLRQVFSTQKICLIEVHSRQVADSLSFLREKRVPEQIFQSPNDVVACFLKWLFEADGCCFGNGRTSVQLKSRDTALLKDVQLLLLYFGIQGRIIDDNLCIRRSRDISLFAEHIGFVSRKKRDKLIEVLKDIEKKRDQNKRKSPQRWEKVVDISPAGMIDVYDFEVPVSHSFIANGIVCHNSGKSQLLKRITHVAPKSRYVSGKGASGTGLTAAVIKDDFLQGYSLEAGALVLANRGIVMIDELDKMSKEDRSAMHEALEQQTVSISKANIQATLRAETTVLAAANPKFGRFDPYGNIADQIDLPSTLINRFDLIFPIKDLPDQQKDDSMASFILDLHQNPEGQQPQIDTKLLRKYIAYAKQHIKPQLTEGAIEEIKAYYLKMRASGATEGAIRSIPISPRQLEGLVRLSEAAARVKLSDKVTGDDARRAIKLLDYCLRQIAFDEETGTIDIDRITTGITATQRSKIVAIKDIITDLENQLGNRIPIEDVIRLASEKGIDEGDVDSAIEKLKRSGDVFEPKRGFISRI